MSIKTKTKRQVKMKFNGRCAYCGCVPDKLCVDHIIPQRNFHLHFGTDKVPVFLRHLKESDVNNMANLFPACNSCNSYKSSFDLEEFRTQIGLLVERLNNYANQFNLVKRFGLVEETGKQVIFYFER